MIELIEIIPSTPENNEPRVTGTVRAIRVSETGEITCGDFPNAEIVREKFEKIVPQLRVGYLNGSEMVFHGVEIEGGFHILRGYTCIKNDPYDPQRPRKFPMRISGGVLGELTEMRRLNLCGGVEYVWCSGWITRHTKEIDDEIEQRGGYATPDIWRKANNEDMLAWLRYQKLNEDGYVCFGQYPFDKQGALIRLYQPGAFSDVAEKAKDILSRHKVHTITFYWLMKPENGLRRCLYESVNRTIKFFDNDGPIDESEEFSARVRECAETIGSSAMFTYYHDQNGEYRIFPEVKAGLGNHGTHIKTPEIFYDVFREIGDVVYSETYRYGDEIVNKFPDNDFFIVCRKW